MYDKLRYSGKQVGSKFDLKTLFRHVKTIPEASQKCN